MGVKLFIRIPEMRKQLILKINLFGLCENAVAMSNTNAIFKNRAVPTNPLISQHLLILDY